MLSMEELLAWRGLDVWRRATGLREMIPHEGFHGTRSISGCNCCTCALTWNRTDAMRIEHNNKKVLENDKEKQMAKSLLKAEVLKSVLDILTTNKNKWHESLQQLLQSMTDTKKICFLRNLIRHLIGLFHERNILDKERYNRKRYELLGFNSSLRTYVPNRVLNRKEWEKN
jgi:hypothetical protein